MLPGDFIAMKMTGECTTTMSALSEGVFWDFKNGGLSSDVINYFGFDSNLFPAIHPLFSPHGMKSLMQSKEPKIRPTLRLSLSPS